METLVRELSVEMAGGLLSVVGVKATLVVLGLALLMWPLRGTSAATRAGLLTTGVLLLLVVPVLNLTTGWWQLELLEFPLGLLEMTPAKAMVADSGATGGWGTASRLGLVLGLPLAGWISLTWALGVVLLLGRFALHRVRAGLLVRDAVEIRDAAFLAEAARVKRELGIAGEVGLAFAACSSPFTFGWRRPLVLLPLEARSWCTQRRRAVLYHEFAHVRRGDYLWLVVTELAQALYWPNPLVWMGARQIRYAQELACDDVALRAGFSSADYARHLLEIARRARIGAPRVEWALSFARHIGLRSRIAAILDDRSDRRATDRRAVGGLALLALLFVVGLSAVSPWRCGWGTDGPHGPPAHHVQNEAPTSAPKGMGG